MVPRADLSDPGVASACLPSSLLGSPATLPPCLLFMGPLLTLRACLSLLLLLAPVESVLTIVRTIPPTAITGPTTHSLLVPVHLCIHGLPRSHCELVPRLVLVLRRQVLPWGVD